jgi:hypothetical protein
MLLMAEEEPWPCCSSRMFCISFHPMIPMQASINKQTLNWCVMMIQKFTVIEDHRESVLAVTPVRDLIPKIS